MGKKVRFIDIIAVVLTDLCSHYMFTWLNAKCATVYLIK